MEAVIPVLTVLVIGLGSLFGYFSEKKSWNEGICPHCQGELVHYDTDSQGGKGYKCSKDCGCDTWVSWFNPEKHRRQIQKN